MLALLLTGTCTTDWTATDLRARLFLQGDRATPASRTPAPPAWLRRRRRGLQHRQGRRTRAGPSPPHASGLQRRPHQGRTGRRAPAPASGSHARDSPRDRGRLRARSVPRLPGAPSSAAASWPQRALEPLEVSVGRRNGRNAAPPMVGQPFHDLANSIASAAPHPHSRQAGRAAASRRSRSPASADRRV